MSQKSQANHAYMQEVDPPNILPSRWEGRCPPLMLLFDCGRLSINLFVVGGEASLHDSTAGRRVP